MKICYLANTTSVHTQRWVKYFADKGHEVHLISFRPFEDDSLQNVKLHTFKVVRGIGRVHFPFAVRRVIRGWNLLLVVIQLRRMIRKINSEILHAHFVSDNGLLGALSGFHPFVMTAWGSDILIAPKKSRLLRWAVKIALKRADLITCDAEHLVERMAELGAAPEKIKIIYFGVDTQRFSPRQKDVRFKEELQLGSDSPTIISLRSLFPLYDIESLVRAVPLVLREVPKAKFIIAGDGEQRVYLEELATSLGVSDSIKFVGLIPSDILPRYLASVDVYVSTALSDAGLSASTAEAMACELPVVVTDFGDNRQWVKDGEGGFIIPLKNPTILAERIVYLLKNEDIRRRFGKINRRVTEKRNNYYREMEKVEHIYQELVKEHKS